MREKENKLRRCDGTDFSLTVKQQQAQSPFYILGIQSSATTQDILGAMRESRAR
jgi:hypothetical protein